MLELEFFT